MSQQLANALRERGHEVVAWTSGDPPASVRSWQSLRWRQQQLERFAAASDPFDAIDLPPLAASRRLARQGPLIARSVQPDLLYLSAELRAFFRRLRQRPLAGSAHLALTIASHAALVAAWHHARVFLCLGSAEHAWMRRRFPWLRPRLRRYLAAPSPEDQQTFGRVRSERRERALGPARYLWIGRWSAHKGISRLVAWASERFRDQTEERLTIAGCGEEAVRDLPPSLIENDRCRVLPYFHRGHLRTLLAEHDAGLFTSHSEGWGLSLNEMLESGLPVFATPAGGVQDLAAYFPRQLRPFPPPPGPLEIRPLDEPAATGYFEACCWPAIAARYEREVLLDTRISSRGRTIWDSARTE